MVGRQWPVDDRSSASALVTVGGRVLKNVAGYDVTKLLVGSYGIFGTPVTFTARTWKRPAAALHVGLSPDVLSKLTSILASPLKPHWAVLTGAGVQFGYHGDDAAIVYYEARIGALEPARVQRVPIDGDDAARLTLWNRSVGFRASVPPANLAVFVRDAGLKDFAADAAFGVVLCSWQIDFDVDLFRETAERHRGNACGVRQPWYAPYVEP